MTTTQKRRIRPRTLLLLALSPLALLALWATGDLAYVSIGVEADFAAPADVIIVFGCPSYENNILAASFSACVRVRAEHAAELYHQGLAPMIIPTGGLTGPEPSEAEAMAQTMVAQGVPRSAIIVEDQALDTIQN